MEVGAGGFGIAGVPGLLAAAAVTAMLGVLLNLVLGLSRVLLAMGRRRDMPHTLASVDERRSTPVRAVLAVGVVISGLRHLVQEGRVEPDEVVVAFITGAGLKTQEAVAPALKPALTVEANIESFQRALEEREGVLPLPKAV